jgi:hypothetical protein
VIDGSPPPSRGSSDYEPQSIEFRISASNETSHTQISDGSPTSPKITLIEFLEQGLALELPKNSCAQGHHLSLAIQVTSPPERAMRFSMTAKVDALTKQPDQTERADLALIQFKEDAWNAFLRLFASRQAEIEDFFNAAKG